MNSTTSALPAANERPSLFSPANSLFAQMLAQESILVRTDSKMKTAAFDPHRRELVLPNWKGFGDAAWYLFIAHEVGHALFTPSTWMKHPKIAAIQAKHKVTLGQIHSALNVLEDIRIERKIRNTYRGLSGVFSRGYAELISRDFFGFGPSMTAQRWAKYGILDHLNLYAKIGSLCGLTLTDANQIKWYNRALACETFDDVLDLTSDLIDHVKGQKNQDPHQGQPQPGQSKEKGEQGEKSKSKDKPKADKADKADKAEKAEEGESESSDGDEKGDSSKGDKGDDSTDSGGEDLEADSEEGDSEDKAGTSAEEADKDSDSKSTQKGEQGDADGDSEENGDDADDTDEGEAGDQNDVNGPASNPEPVEDLESQTQEKASRTLENAARDTDPSAPDVVVLPHDLKYLNLMDADLTTVLKAWGADAASRAIFFQAQAALRREAQTTLASMVSTFRANQSAAVARRVTIGKSGQIDPTRLASYKLTEDLFRPRSFVQKGQNHGFVLNVDWSGSMQGILPTVLWQIVHLVWFAETIKIPVEVYAFTTSNSYGSDVNDARYKQGWSGYSYPAQNICLYSSSAPLTVKNEALAHLLALIYKFGGVVNSAMGAERYSGGLTTYVQPIKATSALMHQHYGSPNIPKALIGKHLDSVLPQFTYDTLRDAMNQPFASLGGTPYFHALMSMVPLVRAFRERNRVEQCVSVWLTDGGDSQGIVIGDPRTTQNYAKGDCRSAIIVSPLTGKTYRPQEADSGRFARKPMAMFLDYHRDATGASVVCIDLSTDPRGVYNAVLPKSDLDHLSSQIAPKQDPLYGGRYRRRRRSVKVKVLKQTSKNLIVKKARGNFAEDGVISIDRVTYPRIGADAYIVSDPTWWTEGNRFLKSKEQEATTVVDAAETAAAVKAAMDAQNTNAAMKKFAEILVPFLADGQR